MGRSGKLIASNDKYILEFLKDPLWEVRADGTVWTRVAKTGRIFVDPTMWREAGHRTKERYFEIHYKGKRLLRHRIVYAAFCSGKDGKPELAEDLTVNHENGVRGDDTPSNLTIGPHGKNNEHRFQVLNRGAVMGNKVLTWEIVRQIRADKKAGASHMDLVRKYGVSKGHVSEIVNNKIWIEGHNYSA